MAESACTIDFMGLVGLFQATDTPDSSAQLPLVVVKEEYPKVENNSGSTKGFNKKRFREKKTAVPSVFDMYQYLASNDAAIDYFKSTGVIKNRVDDRCEELIARSSGRDGYKPSPRQCNGVLIERKFHNKSGHDDPLYSKYYRCKSCGACIHICWKNVLYMLADIMFISFFATFS
jgi:NAD-dependent dihydropyrimidine dehydrogenase PreA subunit